MAQAACSIPAPRARIGDEIPAFEPHPWVRGGHAQTIAGRYLDAGGLHLAATSHDIELADGDRLRVLVSVPEDWGHGDPVALLVHGLAGCARSPYVVRLARRLVRMGILVVRMNMRAAGEGCGLARGIYHAGRSDDLRAVAERIAERAPGSPLALVGYSLGACLALKLATEAVDCPVPGLDCVLAASPPIDLAACARAMQRIENRVYDWNFVRWLRAEVNRLHRVFPELGIPSLGGVRSVYDFDDRYTAPRNGFSSAEDYYARCSVLPCLSRIELPGLVVHAQDDPFIPSYMFALACFPANLRLELTRHGGHVGYVSRNRWLGDRRWLDARLAVWLAARWGIATDRMDPASSSRASKPANQGVDSHHV
jgi:predicted alpha/beta-fold hydrolase